MPVQFPLCRFRVAEGHGQCLETAEMRTALFRLDIGNRPATDAGLFGQSGLIPSQLSPPGLYVPNQGVQAGIFVKSRIQAIAAALRVRGEAPKLCQLP